MNSTFKNKSLRLTSAFLYDTNRSYSELDKYIPAIEEWRKKERQIILMMLKNAYAQ